MPTAPARSAAATISADRIELMKTFVHIVEAGSLSAAAAQMGATQPTVSRRLQTLERSLGLRLLRRSTHAMKLTEDGERYFERAKELLLRWDAFEADLRGAADEPEGSLRVVVPHALGQRLLVGPMAEYLRAHPRVRVEWLLHDRRPDFIAEGVDCAIQAGEVTDPGVIAIKLSEIPRIVVAAPSVLAGAPVPVQAAELATLPWLALQTFYRNDILLTHARTGERCRVPIRPRMSTDSLNALHSAALLGLGVGVGSTWIFLEDLAQGRLVRLVPEWQAAPPPVYLVYPYAEFYPARLRRFIEVMRHALAASVDVP
jgi:DNA-binding transcriptional LysR family regulator